MPPKKKPAPPAAGTAAKSKLIKTTGTTAPLPRAGTAPTTAKPSAQNATAAKQPSSSSDEPAVSAAYASKVQNRLSPLFESMGVAFGVGGGNNPTNAATSSASAGHRGNATTTFTTGSGGGPAAKKTAATATASAAIIHSSSKPSFAPPQPRDYTFPGDEIGDGDDEEDDALPSPSLAGTTTATGAGGRRPTPKRSSKKSKQQQPNQPAVAHAAAVDYAQLFQSLCLSIRLELANRKPGARLASMQVDLDEEFLVRMRMMHPGEVIRLTDLVRLGDLLPDHVSIQRPTTNALSSFSVASAGGLGSFFARTGTATISSALNTGPTPAARPATLGVYTAKLKVDSIPSADDVNQWLEAQKVKAATETVDFERGKRSRGDEAVAEGSAKQSVQASANDAAAAASATRTGTGTAAGTSSTLKKKMAAAEAEVQRQSQQPPPLTPRADKVQDVKSNLHQQHEKHEMSRFLSDERLAAALGSKKASEAAHKAARDAQMQMDLERLLPLYDLVLSIVGLSRRCYAIAKLEVELVGRSRHLRSATSNDFTSAPEDIARQLKALMSFPDAGMTEMQPKRLLFGADSPGNAGGGDSESDDTTPVTAGGGAGGGGRSFGGGCGTGSDSGGDTNSVAVGPGLLILDCTRTNRFRLSNAIDRKKAELAAATETDGADDFLGMTV